MKKTLLTTIQALITIGLLWWIFHDPAKRALMVKALAEANLPWLIPGLLAVGSVFFIQTQRWIMLLRVQKISLPWWTVWRIVMIGGFFNLFLLGSTGGDVVKIFYAMRIAGSRKSAAFLSVLMDRIIGLLALIAVAAVVCALRLPELLAKPQTAALLSAIAIIMGGMLSIVLTGVIVERFDLAKKIPKWLPLHGQIMELASAFSIYARDFRMLAATFAISIPVHLLIFSAFYFAALAFSAGLSLLDVFSVMPIISVITSLPISFSGVGLREGLFQQTFGALYGTPEGVAVLISISGFVFGIIWGIVGGVIYMFYRPGDVHLSDMEGAVSAVEKEIENEA